MSTALIDILSQHVDRDLFFASRAGDASLVESLIEQRSVDDINALDKEGNSALHWAVYNNHPKVVKLLIDHGANVNCVNTSEFQTPLHWGSVTGSVDSIQILLEAEADPLFKDKRGYSSIHLCATNNQLNLLHYLVLKCISTTNHMNISRIIDCMDDKGRTPLHWASYKGYERIVMYLTHQGADVNLADSTGFTPLHWAAQRGHSTIVNKLISLGSKVTVFDAKGNTPQDLAIKKGYFSIAHHLGRASAQPMDRKTLSSPSIYWLWVLAPFTYLTFFVCMISYFSFLPSLFFCFSGYMTIKIFFNKYWLSADFRSPVFIGWFFALFVLSGIAYYGYILPESYQTRFNEHVLFHFCSYIMVYLLITLTMRDPGYIIRDPKTESQCFIDDLLNGKNPKLCTTCLHRVPLRGKHCRSCDRCVSKLDHHCGWINHCVGQKNHKRFLVFVFLLAFSSLFFARHIYVYLRSTYEFTSFLYFLLNIPTIYHESPIYLFIMAAHTAFALYESYVFYEQMTLVFTNTLLSEAINVTKVSYFWSGGHFNNPFNQGPSENVTSFLKGNVDWSNVYNVQDAMEYYSLA